MPYLKRLGLHLAAAVGATTIFVGAVAVGAQQSRPAIVASAVQTPAPRERVTPERSLTGTVREVASDAIVLQNARGRQWRVAPFAGALVKRNGRVANLGAIQVGDRVVVLGQAQARDRFMAHAITARTAR
jgi:hypothetical protein